LQCIAEFSKDNEPGDDVECPLCRKEFQIPQKRVEDLPKNFLIEQLTDLVEAPEGSEKAKTSKASEMKVFCQQHNKKVLELFCLDCKMPICALCCVKLHKKHEYADVNEVASEYRKQVTDDIKTMVRSLAQCRELVERQKRSKTEFIDDVDKVKREISEQVEQVKQMIDRDEQILLVELEVFKTERVKLIDNMVADTEQHAAFIDSLMKYTEELRDKGTACDVTQQMSSLHNRTEELAKLDAMKQAMEDLRSYDVSFTATTRPLTKENSVGRVNIREHQKPPGEKWKINLVYTFVVFC
jgi:hypothetical protein